MTLKKMYMTMVRDVRFPICIAMICTMLMMTGFISNKHVTIQADGQRIELNSPYREAANILSQAGIELGANDQCVMSVDSNGDNVLTISRAIPVVVEYNNQRVTLNTVKVTAGEIAAELGYVGNTYKLNVEEDTPLTAGMVIKVADVKPEPPKVIPEAGNRPYTERITMEATAYLPTDGSAEGLTATGVPAARGIVAVDPRVIPLGTRVYIPGYGEAVAADTGGAIKGYKIDLCMESYGEAMEFGRRDIEVYILE